MIQDTEWAYIAGLFEGEGCAGNYNSGRQKNGKQRKRIQVSISQKNPMVLKWLKKILGYGRLRVKNDGISEWRIKDSNGKEFLRSILPYMKFRIDYINAVLLGKINTVSEYNEL